MQNENLIRIVLAVILTVVLSISITFRRRAAKAGDKIDMPAEEGRGIFILRTLFALGGWGGIFLYLIYPPALSWAQIDLPWWLRWAGVGLFAACAPLFYWMFSSLGNNITHTVAIREKHSLVQHGPYRYIRHPLYAFGYLAFLGFSLASGSLFIFVMLLGVFVVLDRRADLEEARLIERFGSEYINYMKVTGRYLP
jgi:protein-S-isoprenylcysteine O-methyltransferase Ste14